MMSFRQNTTAVAGLSPLMWSRYTLHFAFTARTSRETMTRRDTYFIRRLDASTGAYVYGECNFFESLAPESRSEFLSQLQGVCDGTLRYSEVTSSAVRCGLDILEAAPAPLNNWGRGLEGIPINGLVWMADKATMAESIRQKLADGFRVIKLKIGGIDFESELELIKSIRRQFSPSDIEIRLDANGSFTPENAMERLDRLSRYSIHSIEQPLKAGLWPQTAELCQRSPIPIALDEELIGLRSEAEKAKMLETLHPAYIILKPSLCGGLKEAARWIVLAQSRQIGWWLTSALESNVGLMALARFVSAYCLTMPQGLGTGRIYTNNIDSSLYLQADRLFTHNPMTLDVAELERLHWH